MACSIRWLVGLIVFLALPAHAERWLVRATDVASVAALGGGGGLHVLRSFEHIPWASVEGTEAELREMVRTGRIQSYEKDVLRRPTGLPLLIAAGAAALLSACGGDDSPDANDPDNTPQTVGWGVQKIRAPDVHSRTKGKGVKVAVIDTGIDAQHPDVTVVAGKNFVLNSPAPGDIEWDDCNGHGTHVAGIIGAQDNAIGVLGVAPEVSLYAARVFDCQGDQGFVSTIVAAVDWAIDQRVNVINMSLGGSQATTAEQEAVDAAKAAGIVVVAAAGNESGPLSFPGAFDSVISVGATDSKDALASFSNRGPELDVAAPGVGILSSVPLGFSVVSELRQGSKSYASNPLAYSGTGKIEGKLYYCGLALAPGDCPAEVNGNIALILRGQNFFSDKITQVTRAGAKAAIVFNHTEDGGGLYNGTLQTPNKAWIPAVAISNGDGLNLKSLNEATVTLDVKNGPPYDEFDGTSQATPHVSGLVALMLAARPGLTPDLVKDALIRGAIDLGSKGRDDLFGGGRVDAPNALGVVGVSVSARPQASFEPSPSSPALPPAVPR